MLKMRFALYAAASVEQGNAHHYREQAERLRREAETVLSEAMKHQLLIIAQQYDLLADSVSWHYPNQG
jgi:hypothetical protein